jgi:predicted proteasome-type protease
MMLISFWVLALSVCPLRLDAPTVAPTISLVVERDVPLDHAPDWRLVSWDVGVMGDISHGLEACPLLLSDARSRRSDRVVAVDLRDAASGVGS